MVVALTGIIMVKIEVAGPYIFFRGRISRHSDGSDEGS